MTALLLLAVQNFVEPTVSEINCSLVRKVVSLWATYPSWLWSQQAEFSRGRRNYPRGNQRQLWRKGL